MYSHVFCSPPFLFLFQDKITKEVNFILANQEIIQSQTTHLDDAIKQMEVNLLHHVSAYSSLKADGPLEAGCCSADLMKAFQCFVHSLDSALGSSPGEQHGGSPSTGSLCPRAGSSCSRTSGCSDRGPGGLPLSEERGPLCSALREEKSVGARRPDGLHAGAAQGDGRALLRAGCQEHSPQVAHSSAWRPQLDRVRWAIRVCFLCRLAKAIENLRCFSLAADPSFRHFHSDASKEVQAIQGLEFIRGRPFC